MKNIIKVLVGIFLTLFSIYEVYDNFFSSPDYGESLTVNGTTIYYQNTDTASVRALGDYLTSAEFSDGTEKSVQFIVTDSSYIIKAIYEEETLSDSSSWEDGFSYARTLSPVGGTG